MPTARDTEGPAPDWGLGCDTVRSGKRLPLLRGVDADTEVLARVLARIEQLPNVIEARRWQAG